MISTNDGMSKLKIVLKQRQIYAWPCQTAEARRSRALSEANVPHTRRTLTTRCWKVQPARRDSGHDSISVVNIKGQGDDSPPPLSAADPASAACLPQDAINNLGCSSGPAVVAEDGAWSAQHLQRNRHQDARTNTARRWNLLMDDLQPSDIVAKADAPLSDMPR
jgi:hypothetical protein